MELAEKMTSATIRLDRTGTAGAVTLDIFLVLFFYSVTVLYDVKYSIFMNRDMCEHIARRECENGTGFFSSIGEYVCCFIVAFFEVQNFNVAPCRTANGN